jgi:ABC-type molybdate transport system substrate-binding protein
MKTGIVAIVSAALISLSAASAAEIKVLSTQATEQSYRELIPLFEKATGHKVTTLFTGTLDADKRIAAGEPYDRARQPRRSRTLGRRGRREGRRTQARHQFG